MPGGSGAGGTSLTQDTDASSAPPGSISLIPSLAAGGARAATVTADSTLEVWRLGDDALARMRRHDADLAGRFHEMIVRLLGERLSETNRLVGALMA